MNKSKLAIGLMTAVLSCGALAGCDNTVRYSADGAIISYVEKEGNKEIEVKYAQDLLKDFYYKDSSKYQSIFDAIYSIVVRNYFSKNTETVNVKTKDKDGNIKPEPKDLGLAQMPEIEIEANRLVDSDKTTAKTNALNNDTSYSDEFEAILSSKGVEDEEELYEKYVEEGKKSTFEDNFYKYHIDLVKKGDPSVKYASDESKPEEKDANVWNGYFEDMVPYHVSHILVKVEDGSGTNYANGTISEKDADNLYNVVSSLREGKDSFGFIAKANKDSGDAGSAENFGDLGIMDYSTGYVNEFKLGVYAYENFFGSLQSADSKSNIKLNDEIKNNFKDEITESFGSAIPTIPYSVFEELEEVKDTDKDKKGKSVIDDSANYYPRNIIYNKYLNRHSVAFITNDTADTDLESKFSGFKAYDGIGNILVVKTSNGTWAPILCTRAGSDYQGIHFIIVNRSPFEGEGEDKVVNGVSLDNYYTTYYPEQELDYPVDASKKTYVTYSSTVTTDTKARAESLVSTLKSYDSDRLNKYIFQKFFEMEGLHLSDQELWNTLQKWIYRGFEKKQSEQEDSWEKTWNDYIDTLKKQNSERQKLVSQACRIAYLNGNSKDYISADDYAKMKRFLNDEGITDEAKIKELIGDGSDGSSTGDKPMTYSELFKEEGGLCNDGKAHL